MEIHNNQRRITATLLVLLAAAVLSVFAFSRYRSHKQILQKKQSAVLTLQAGEAILDEDYEAAWKMLDEALTLNVNNRSAARRKLDLLLMQRDPEQAHVLAVSSEIAEVQAYLKLLEGKEFGTNGSYQRSEFRPCILQARLIDLEKDGCSELLLCSLEQDGITLQLYDYDNAEAVQKTNGVRKYPLSDTIGENGEIRYDLFVTECDDGFVVGLSCWEDPMKYVRTKSWDSENDLYVVINESIEEMTLTGEEYQRRGDSFAELLLLTETGFEVIDTFDDGADAEEKTESFRRYLRDWHLEAEADSFSADTPCFRMEDRTQQRLLHLRITSQGCDLYLIRQEPENPEENFETLMEQYYLASLWQDSLFDVMPPRRWQGNVLMLEKGKYTCARTDLNGDGIDEFCIYMDGKLLHLWAYNGFSYVLAYSQSEESSVLYENALQIGRRIYTLSRRGTFIEVKTDGAAS